MTPREKAEKYATQDLNGIPLKSFDVEKAYLAGYREALKDAAAFVDRMRENDRTFEGNDLLALGTGGDE